MDAAADDYNDAVEKCVDVVVPFAAYFAAFAVEKLAIVAGISSHLLLAVASSLKFRRRA